VFISLDKQLRRHRRKLTAALAVLAVAAVAMTAHAALMSGTGDHMSDGAGICLTVGGCVAVLGVAVFAHIRLRRRPLWLIPAPLAAAPPFVAMSNGFLSRAGPPRLLQVFLL
jgi:hypothetical protein